MIKAKPKPQNWEKKRRPRLEFWLTRRKETFSLIREDFTIIPNLASVSRRAKIQMKKMKIMVGFKWRKGQSWEKLEEHTFLRK